jgi:sugar phosphate isomerase/epimerase
VYRALSAGAIGVKEPFEQAVALAAKYGFQGIQVGAGDIEALGLAQVRRLLDEHHLLPAVTGIPVNFRQDDAVFEEGMAALPAFCQSMSELGCLRAVTWFMPWHATLTYDAYFQQMRVRSARICEVLARYGMRYGLEFVGPETLRSGKPNPFIHDIDGLLSLIDAVGADNLGFLLDAFHWYTSGGTAADLAKLSDRLVVSVHVNDAIAGRTPQEQIDNQRALPGETGVIDIRTFMRSLDGMGYTGAIIVEPFSQRLRDLPSEEAVAETARSLDKIWEIAGL